MNRRVTSITVPLIAAIILWVELHSGNVSVSTDRGGFPEGYSKGVAIWLDDELIVSSVTTLSGHRGPDFEKFRWPGLYTITTALGSKRQEFEVCICPTLEVLIFFDDEADSVSVHPF